MSTTIKLQCRLQLNLLLDIPTRHGFGKSFFGSVQTRNIGLMMFLMMEGRDFFRDAWFQCLSCQRGQLNFIQSLPTL